MKNLLNSKKVVSSNFLKKGTLLEITPLGLKDSIRNVNDGNVYFGINPNDSDEKTFEVNSNNFIS